ncbi:uncharacterized protein LOC112569567 isoform X1 [Pomacea canaliculata]|nr:uncharacterized protein LOC112569567 isoform X1 [Pomacea canaliculata]
MTTMAKTSEYFLMFVTLGSLLHNTSLMTDAISDIPRDLSRYQVIKAEDKDKPRVTFHIKADVCNNTTQFCRIKLTTYEAGLAVDQCKFCVQNQSCISSNTSKSCSCVQSEKGDIIYYNDTVNFAASNIQIFFWFATTVSSLETEKPVETVFMIRESGAKQADGDAQCSCFGLLLIIVPCACVIIDVSIGVICIVRRRRKTQEARVPVGDPFPKESLDMTSKHLDHKPHLAQLPRMRGSHLHHEPHPRRSLNVSGKGLDQDSHRKSAPSKLLYHEPHKKESSNSTGKSLDLDPRAERSPNKQVTDHSDIRDSTTDDSYDHLQRA